MRFEQTTDVSAHSSRTPGEDNPNPRPDLQQNATPCNNKKSSPDDPDHKHSKDHHLSTQQFAAIELLLQGLSDAKIARKLGLNRSTIYRWRTSDLPFRLLLQKFRCDQFENASNHLRALLPAAVESLEKQLQDPKTTLRAAAILLRFTAPKNVYPQNPEQLLCSIQFKNSLSQLLPNQPSPPI